METEVSRKLTLKPDKIITKRENYSQSFPRT